MIRKLLSSVRLQVTLFALLIAGFSYGSTGSHDTVSHQVTTPEEAHSEKAFDAGAMIIDHIVDAHEWHILTYNDFHLSIPLPVILIDNGKLVSFSSSHFHHGHDAYKGYKLMVTSTKRDEIA